MSPSLEDIPLGIILGIAGLLVLVSIFGPWASVPPGEAPDPDTVVTASEDYTGFVVFAGAWMMIIGSVIYFEGFKSKKLQDLRPKTDAGLGLVGSVISILGAYYINIGWEPEYTILEWGYYLALIGASVGVIASIVIIVESLRTSPSYKKKKKRGGGL